MPRRNRNAGRKTVETGAASLQYLARSRRELPPVPAEPAEVYIEPGPEILPACLVCGTRLPPNWPHPQHARCRYGRTAA